MDIGVILEFPNGVYLVVKCVNESINLMCNKCNVMLFLQTIVQENFVESPSKFQRVPCQKYAVVLKILKRNSLKAALRTQDYLFGVSWSPMQTLSLGVQKKISILDEFVFKFGLQF
ncbi:uncharacterized protein ACN427_000461 [Glossina fuscipes fuscipes]